jgi:hypothetical protein
MAHTLRLTGRFVGCLRALSKARRTRWRTHPSAHRARVCRKRESGPRRRLGRKERGSAGTAMRRVITSSAVLIGAGQRAPVVAYSNRVGSLLRGICTPRSFHRSSPRLGRLTTLLRATACYARTTTSTAAHSRFAHWDRAPSTPSVHCDLLYATCPRRDPRASCSSSRFSASPSSVRAAVR